MRRAFASRTSGSELGVEHCILRAPTRLSRSDAGIGDHAYERPRSSSTQINTPLGVTSYDSDVDRMSFGPILSTRPSSGTELLASSVSKLIPWVPLLALSPTGCRGNAR